MKHLALRNADKPLNKYSYKNYLGEHEIGDTM
jgi:hypothetical protein